MSIIISAALVYTRFEIAGIVSITAHIPLFYPAQLSSREITFVSSHQEIMASLKLYPGTQTF